MSRTAFRACPPPCRHESLLTRASLHRASSAVPSSAGRSPHIARSFEQPTFDAPMAIDRVPDMPRIELSHPHRTGSARDRSRAPPPACSPGRRCAGPAPPGRDQFGRLDRLRVERLPAGKGQQSVGQRRGPRGSGLGRREIAVEVTGPTLRHACLQQLQAAADAGQQVVEIKCKAAGELA